MSNLRSLRRTLVHVNESAADAKENLMPGTMRQLLKINSYLRGDTNFYIACYCPCDAGASLCPKCGESLKTNRGRPKHLFFLRRVRPWLKALVDMPLLRDAIAAYRKRTGTEGVWADYLDGDYVRDLIKQGMD